LHAACDQFGERPRADAQQQHARTADDLLEPAALVADLDLATIEGMPRAVSGELTPGRAAEVYGIAGWFDTTLAEGVEQPAQWDFLAQEGCDAAQGYLYARPMALPDLQAWLGRQRL